MARTPKGKGGAKPPASSEKKKKKPDPAVKAAADRAERRMKGEPDETDFSDLEERFAPTETPESPAKPVATRRPRGKKLEKGPKAPTKKKKDPGRPTKRTKGLETLIIARMMGGESVREICRDPSVPSRATIHNWLAEDAANGVEGGFLDQYARAQEVRAADIFDEIIEIADDDTEDFLPDEEGGYYFNREHVQRSKLRMEGRQWVLARMSPKKYGPKGAIELTGPGGGSVRVIRGDMSAAEAAEEYKRTLEGESE